ncbi:MAG: hypothetical protein HC916_22270, partial [Coleofasciculaceae cyanobacterium SM2_1_6]|nr:hypothetical protein [Coleofasciculaceae cyanobacterium SM2_1_6]
MWRGGVSFPAHLCLSSHPGTVKQELVINLGSDRTLETKRHHNFQDYRDQVMEQLRHQPEEMLVA